MSSPNLESGNPADAAPGCRFIVGQDISGHWLAIDAAHRGGGVFKSRADALHFAGFESGHRPGGVSLSLVPLRLEF